MTNKSIIRVSVLLNSSVFIFILYDLFYNKINMHLLVHIFIMCSQLFLTFLSLGFFKAKVGELNTVNANILSKYEESEEIKSLVLNKSPSGVVVLDSSGIIQYVNPAIGKILGSTETVGLNMLEFDTVQKSKMYEGIKNALKGIPIEIIGEPYTSYTTGVKKILNIYIYQIPKKEKDKTDRVIIIIHDVTREFKLKEEAEATYLSTMEALAEAVDKKDAYTGQHSKNVSKYSSLLCENLNLDEEEFEQISIAAAVHDIGKIGIEDDILRKPDKLTSEEYDKMKEHSQIGADIIKKISGFERISKIIRHHHERFDGNGYPEGLKGDEIPLGSQIIAVADTYDAITSNRVYRSSLGKEKAIQILLEERGKQFNPLLVDIFLNNIESLDLK